MTPEQQKVLVTFCDWAIDTAFEGGSLDAFDLEQEACRLGLTEQIPCTEENRADWESIYNCDLEIGDYYYRVSPWFRELRKAVLSSPAGTP